MCFRSLRSRSTSALRATSGLVFPYVACVHSSRNFSPFSLATPRFPVAGSIRAAPVKVLLPKIAPLISRTLSMSPKPSSWTRPLARSSPGSRHAHVLLHPVNVEQAELDRLSGGSGVPEHALRQVSSESQGRLADQRRDACLLREVLSAALLVRSTELGVPSQPVLLLIFPVNKPLLVFCNSLTRSSSSAA